MSDLSAAAWPPKWLPAAVTRITVKAGPALLALAAKRQLLAQPNRVMPDTRRPQRLQRPDRNSKRLSPRFAILCSSCVGGQRPRWIAPPGRAPSERGAEQDHILRSAGGHNKAGEQRQGREPLRVRPLPPVGRRPECWHHGRVLRQWFRVPRVLLVRPPRASARSRSPATPEVPRLPW